MTRVSLASDRNEGRFLFRQLPVYFERKVVGAKIGWPTTLDQEQAIRIGLMLEDWDLPRTTPAPAGDEFRNPRLEPLVIVLFNRLGALHQATLSGGTDVHNSKSEMPVSMAQRLMADAERICTCLSHQVDQRT